MGSSGSSACVKRYRGLGSLKQFYTLGVVADLYLGFDIIKYKHKFAPRFALEFYYLFSY